MVPFHYRMCFSWSCVVCVCVCVRACACVCVCLRACVRACVRAYACLLTLECPCMLVHVYVCIDIDALVLMIDACIHVCKYLRMYVCMHVWCHENDFA